MLVHFVTVMLESLNKVIYHLLEMQTSCTNFGFFIMRLKGQSYPFLLIIRISNLNTRIYSIKLKKLRPLSICSIVNATNIKNFLCEIFPIQLPPLWVFNGKITYCRFCKNILGKYFIVSSLNIECCQSFQKYLQLYWRIHKSIIVRICKSPVPNRFYTSKSQLTTRNYH